MDSKCSARRWKTRATSMWPRRSFPRSENFETPRPFRPCCGSCSARTCGCNFTPSFPASKVDELIDQAQSTAKRDVRAFILKLLGWSGDERAIAVLLSFLDQPETAEVAAQALIDFGPLAVPPILDALQNAQED